jgi:hypothetical protein
VATRTDEELTSASEKCAGELVAKPTEFGPMLPATAGVVLWLIFLIGEGPIAGIETVWLLFIALPLGARTMLMRLRFGGGKLRLTVGPRRREVDLGALESVSWKMTGGWRSRGTIVVQDKHGGRVPIYVGRFTRKEAWGPLLLAAAKSSNARVDTHSRHLLEGAGAARTLRRT